MNEITRRALQQKMVMATGIIKDKKELSRTAARQYLKFLKRDTLGLMTDLGVLRSRQDYGMQVKFMAPFYKQVETDQKNVQGGREAHIDDMFESATANKK